MSLAAGGWFCLVVGEEYGRCDGLERIFGNPWECSNAPTGAAFLPGRALSRVSTPHGARGLLVPHVSARKNYFGLAGGTLPLPTPQKEEKRYIRSMWIHALEYIIHMPHFAHRESTQRRLHAARGALLALGFVQDAAGIAMLIDLSRQIRCSSVTTRSQDARNVADQVHIPPKRCNP